MKILPFTIPVPHDRTIIVMDEVLPYFYTHLHRHQEIQLTWIIEGNGTLIAGNNIHPFKGGEIYLLGANLPHVFKSDPSYFEADNTQEVHTLTIFFNPGGALSSLFDLPEMKFVRSFLQHLLTGFKIPDTLFRDISSRMLSIYQLEGIDLLMQFLQLLKSCSSVNKLEPLTVNVNAYLPAITDNEGMRIGLIYNYIIQNFDKPLTLEDIAEQAHMTPHAFCRYFKKHTRHTFVNFLNKIRINEACKMLNNNTGDSIASVAYSCGFSSITNFNRVFKIVTGKSPSAYTLKYADSVETVPNAN
jgi:AraC-like DNA-binding protein